MIYDITQPVFQCEVFPGDPAPKKETLNSTADGGLYNLTAFSMCAHNGTHVDAPFHFLQEGKTIEEMDLSCYVGKAYVAEYEGEIGAEEIRCILTKAAEADPEAARRILVKGKAVLSAEAAEILVQAESLTGMKVLLYGNESQTVGPENAPMKVHLILLGSEITLLEGIRLGTVSEGVYTLNCAPLNLGPVDGAPCRAVLMD